MGWAGRGRGHKRGLVPRERPPRAQPLPGAQLSPNSVFVTACITVVSSITTPVVNTHTCITSNNSTHGDTGRHKIPPAAQPPPLRGRTPEPPQPQLLPPEPQNNPEPEKNPRIWGSLSPSLRWSPKVHPKENSSSQNSRRTGHQVQKYPQSLGKNGRKTQKLPDISSHKS